MRILKNKKSVVICAVALVLVLTAVYLIPTRIQLETTLCSFSDVSDTVDISLDPLTCTGDATSSDPPSSPDASSSTWKNMKARRDSVLALWFTTEYHSAKTCAGNSRAAHTICSFSQD